MSFYLPEINIISFSFVFSYFLKLIFSIALVDRYVYLLTKWAWPVTRKDVKSFCLNNICYTWLYFLGFKFPWQALIIIKYKPLLQFGIKPINLTSQNLFCHGVVLSINSTISQYYELLWIKKGFFFLVIQYVLI